MPWRPKTPCRRPGCGALVDPPGLCDEHRHQEQRTYNAERKARNDATDAFYHTARWQRHRSSVLRAEPLCRHCAAKGRVVAAVLVDHIEPVKQGGDMWDSANLQPLCNLCHERKSAAEGSRG